METLDKKRRRVQVIFTRKMEERKLFMQELKQYRHQGTLRAYRKILKSVGPKWFQVLSSSQINSLRTLKMCIHRDLLQGTPNRVMDVMHTLGIYPAPKAKDLFDCMIIGRYDPKEFLAEYYYILYEYPINRMMHKYQRNGKLLCSAIYYLGLEEMILFLEEKYKPDPRPPPPPPKPKRRIKGPNNPYLAPETTVKKYEPRKIKRSPPPPLPKDLSSLSEPYVEELPVPRRVPPPPPPPPPKKRLTVSYCSKWSGYVPSQFRSLYDYDYDLIGANYVPPPKKVKKKRVKSIMPEDYSLLEKLKKRKKKYGIDSGKEDKKKPKPKLLRPNLPNEQYLIQGVHYCQGRNIFIVGNVVRLPDAGNLHHGGTAIVKNESVKIHKGLVFRSIFEKEGQSDCDCYKNYYKAAFKHLKNTKCLCGHRYDFRNEGTFSDEQDPYFEGASRYGGYQFNYDIIFDNQPKDILEVKRLAKEIWETDSNLASPNEGTEFKKKKMKKKDAKKVVEVNYCLPENPKIEDYLRCALRYLRKTNAAARLPDLHLAAELREWMRRRLYGPLTDKQKRRYMHLSTKYWTYLDILQKRGFCKPLRYSKYIQFDKDADWTQKYVLQKKFMNTIEECKQRVLKTQLHLNNVLWATMYTAKFPDENFRDIFFAYQIYQPSHITMFHPYDIDDVMKLRSLKFGRPYKCAHRKSMDVTRLA